MAEENNERARQERAELRANPREGCLLYTSDAADE